MRIRRWIPGSGLLAALSLLGCAGEGPPPDGDQTWFDQIQSEVFDQSCVAGACHDTASRQGNLILVAGESFDQLVDVEPENAAARAAGLLRVEPGSATQSFLVRKLTGNLTPTEGSRMPLGSTPLADDQIASVIAWIEAGASPTDPPP